jgi:hypothetical protein
MGMDAILEPIYDLWEVKICRTKLMVKYLVENLGINPEKSRYVWWILWRFHYFNAVDKKPNEFKSGAALRCNGLGTLQSWIHGKYS